MPAAGVGPGAAAAACRGLGYSSGVALDTGTLTALQGPGGDVESVVRVVCPDGEVAGPSECDITTAEEAVAPSPMGVPVEAGESYAAVMCSSPSGALMSVF